MASVQLTGSFVIRLDLEIDHVAAAGCGAIECRFEQLLADALGAMCGENVQLFEPGRLAAVLDAPGKGQVGNAGRGRLGRGQQKAAPRHVREDGFDRRNELIGGKRDSMLIELKAKQADDRLAVRDRGLGDSHARL
jgi:hypothetical protein